MPEQLSVPELPPGSHEAFVTALDALARTLPEVAARRTELEASGLALIGENGLEASFFENEGRGRLFVGIASLRADIDTMKRSVTPDAELSELQAASAAREHTFIDSFIAVIGHDHSAHERLAGAKEDIELTYRDVNGVQSIESMTGAYEKYTDQEKSRSVQAFADRHDIFADQRRLLGIATGDDLPYTIRVIRLRNNHDADRAGVAEMLRASGMIAFNRLPKGWVEQRETRVICIREDVADAILAHEEGASLARNSGITVLKHEKAHLERDWRLGQSLIGAAFNEMGAEILAGSLPDDWNYIALRDLKDHYNECLNDGGDDPDADEPPMLDAAAAPPTYMEELLVSTPAGADAFSHVITGIARQTGLRTMVKFAAQMAGGEMQFPDQYHTALRNYVKSPDERMPMVRPLPASMRTPVAAPMRGTVGESSVAVLVSRLGGHYSALAEARTQLHASTTALLEAFATAYATFTNTENKGVQALLDETATAYDQARNAALHIGKTLLAVQAYAEDIT